MIKIPITGKLCVALYETLTLIVLKDSILINYQKYTMKELFYSHNKIANKFNLYKQNF